MEKIVTKYSSFDSENKADDELYRSMSYQDKLRLLLNLIFPPGRPHEHIKRSVRIYSASQREEG